MVHFLTKIHITKISLTFKRHHQITPQSKMSTASKVTFASTCVFAVGAFVFINYSQQAERAAMRIGPIRDAERMQARELTKKQRVNDLEHKEQMELREKLIQIQPLSDEIIRGEEK